MRTRYRLSKAAWGDFEQAVQNKASETGVRRVCEVGAGANPLLAPDFAEQHGFDYVLLDASAEELAKADPSYTKLEANMEAAHLDAGGPYDLVFSRFTAEHVRSPQAFHRNVHAMLTSSGWAMHFFPTLYSAPFVVNRIVPERITNAVLLRIQPGRTEEGLEGKFPAYYRWCRGPSERQRERFERVGFEVVEYNGYYGHGYYDPVPGLRTVAKSVAERLARRPIALLTSYAYVLLRRRA